MVTTQGYEFISDRFNVEPPPTSTRYGLEIRGSNPGGVERFSATAQTVPGAHPASYTMVTGESGREVVLIIHPVWRRG